MPDDLSQQIAKIVYSGFKSYRQDFQEITLAAQSRFENTDWLGAQEAGTRRLAVYGEHLLNVVSQLNGVLAERQITATLWARIRAAYLQLINAEYNAELFETFYNSVHRHITEDKDVTDLEMFVTSAHPTPPLFPDNPIFSTYRPKNDVVEMVFDIFHDFSFNVPWRNLEQDIGNILRSLAEERTEIKSTKELEVQILRSLFFRNKCAYIIGKLSYKKFTWPVVLPLLLNDSRQLYVDTLICDEDELSVMFSFTRSYFMVHTTHPHAMVDFLQSLLPNKKRSELYASIGLHKHGKTEFYRGFVAHLDSSTDQFIVAPGIKGMVMTVFTLPSYQTVFKVIKDRFAPQKSITAQQVREKYHVVKKHDRVGRMADTQEFQNLVLPRQRFAAELIEELLSTAPSSIEVSNDRVLIKHLYTERLMTPLNIFIDIANDDELLEALDEYGNAIKELAAANIFPGDMLLKNFGITRHGRVVFYDYDEICYLTDVNFRAIPEAQTLEDEMAAEAWYSVAPNDVFPEEFKRFLFGRRRIKQMFADMHGELFDPAYWQSLQKAIAQGQVMDVFPYRRKKRFDSYPHQESA
ncbi:MAG: bifunctional isocitrate dehydrogenase kinase/phosphatase [Gammaproteobacteria bacterium]|nr:bifunctional isocitrate dehydrogenase kinase/phosphatase [Pseudomonadota bacterium]TDJ35302.1 MAG: bifunctional isocitrate dehydrogenase kinase/phosphatase [Gammaproteobacteria bacterium]